MESQGRASISVEALADLLPETVVTRSKLTFNPRLDLWSYQDGVTKVYIDFGRIPAPFVGHILALKHTLLFYAKFGAPPYLQNLFEAYLHFVRTLESEGGREARDFGLSDIWKYIEMLGLSGQSRLGNLNVLLQKWFHFGMPGVTEECVTFLRARRKPGNEKGRAVRTHDPIYGAFTELEYVALYRAVDAAYARGELQQGQHVLIRLLFATGQRIAQFASMKLCDLKVVVDEHGYSTYQVSVPQVKKGLAHAREAFETYDLSPQTGLLAMGYIATLKAGGCGDNSPLFSIANKKGEGQGIFGGHCTSMNLQKSLSSSFRALAPSTARLGGAPMPVSPRRFRYTLGTRLAQERHSLYLIARALGHSDLQNASVYIEATPTILENVDNAMGEYLTPLAQAFVGRIVDDEASSTAKGAPGSRIWDFKSAKAPVGSCVENDGCGFLKPVACYTCINFEPWVDAPHEKLLAQLVAERARVLATEGDRIGVINDPAIIAIREVMVRCQKDKEQRVAKVVV